MWASRRLMSGSLRPMWGQTPSAVRRSGCIGPLALVPIAKSPLETFLPQTTPICQIRFVPILTRGNEYEISPDSLPIPPRRHRLQRQSQPRGRKRIRANFIFVSPCQYRYESYLADWSCLREKSFKGRFGNGDKSQRPNTPGPPDS